MLLSIKADTSRRSPAFAACDVIALENATLAWDGTTAGVGGARQPTDDHRKIACNWEALTGNASKSNDGSP